MRDLDLGMSVKTLKPAFYEKWFNDRWPVWAAKLLRAASVLVRTRLVGVEQAKKMTCGVAHWHGDELALLPCFGHLNITILVSQSKDGERMATGARALGYRVTRGSSTRGGVGGLLTLIKAVREGHKVVLAVDGPNGPRGVCKPGIIRVVQKTGVPLFPVGLAGSKRLVFQKSWNQAYLPLPFSRQVIFVDKPRYFPPKADSEIMAQCCREVEQALYDAQHKAQALLDQWGSRSKRP